MGRQWLRSCTVDVDGRQYAYDEQAAGDGSVTAGLRVRFQVQQTTVKQPNSAQIRIFNLSNATAQLPKPGSKVTLTAGYRDNKGLIFHGTVKQALKGKESPVDTFLHLNCGDGDRGFNHAIANKSLAKGSTGDDVFKYLMSEFQKFDISLGGIGQKAMQALSQLKYPRAQAIFGMARDPLQTLAATIGGTWSIQNGKVHFVHKDDTLGGNKVLRADTGLIGMPVETTNGIIIRCLIDPTLEVDQEVTLDPSTIQRAIAAPDIKFDIEKGYLDSLNTMAGNYKIVALDWEGDTRGQEWYATLTCIGRGGSVPASQLGNLGPNDISVGTR